VAAKGMPGCSPSGASRWPTGASSANGTVLTQIVRAATLAGDGDGDGDPRDANRYGKITVLDARKISLSCTRPNCARE